MREAMRSSIAHPTSSMWVPAHRQTTKNTRITKKSRPCVLCGLCNPPARTDGREASRLYFESDIHPHIDFDRLAIQQRRVELPLTDRIDCRLLEARVG